MPKYVLTKNGNIKIGKDGNPLIKKDGKEYEINAIGAQEKIDKLVSESNERRKKSGKYKTKLEETEKERDELKTKYDSLDSDVKKQIEKVEAGVNSRWEEKQKSWEDEKLKFNEKMFELEVGSKFPTSKILQKTILTPAIAKSYYSKNFINKDGEIVGVDNNGNVIYSKQNPGKKANFEEVLEALIDNDPDKDNILKAGSSDGGGGFNSDNGGNDDQNGTGSLIEQGLAEMD